MRLDLSGVIKLSLIIFCAVPLFALQANDEIVLLDFVYEGQLPKNVYFQKWQHVVKCGDLFGGGDDQIIVKDSTYFEVIQFDGEHWATVREIPFTDSLKEKAKENCAWELGDLNQNGKDEIFSFFNHKLVRYEWDGEKFNNYLHIFPYIIDDVTIGDIDNDQANEMVMLCYQDPTPGRRPVKLHLCVCELEDDEIRIVWDDEGELGYKNRFFVPPDQFGFIADFENNGKNQLIVKKSQSDRSARLYNLVYWDGSGLMKINSFEIIDGKIVPTERKFHETPFSWGYLTPIEIDAKPMFFDRMDYRKGSRDVILKREGAHFKIIQLVDEPSGKGGHYVIGGDIFWMDMNGKGKGLLVLEEYSYANNPITYSFYRLRLGE